jgi:hypothetical protein
MVRTFLGAALVVTFAGSIQAQQQGVPSTPVPVLQPPPGSNSTLPPITLPGAAPPPYVPSTPIFIDPAPAMPPRSAPPVRPAPEGFYGTLEIDLLYPQLRGWLSGPVAPGGINDTVTLGSANLAWVGSPRLEVGWRLPEAMGAVAVSYRSVVSTGRDTIPDWDFLGAGFLTSRLNMNVVDVDYVSPAYGIAPCWDVAWRAGVRFAAVYFDHDIVGGFAQQQATNNFVGAGPHAMVEVARALDLVPGLSLSSKLDFALLVGDVSQSFDETLNFPGGFIVGDTSRFHSTEAVPVLTYSIGLTYAPPSCGNWARFGFGYQVEYWWDIGSRGDSRTDLSVQGLYFRGEFNF